MKKLIAIDVDGTLVTKRQVLTPATAKFLRSLQEKGHVIVLASGRPYRSLAPFYEQCGLKSPLICYNGALVFNPENSSFPVILKRFSCLSLRRIAVASKGHLSSFLCESEETIYDIVHDDFLDQYFPYEGMNEIEGPLEETLREDPFTAVFHCSKGYQATLKKIVEKEANMRFRPWTNSSYSEAYLLGVDKGSALRHVAQQLGIRKEDIIAFGDSDNDKEMLLEAGQPFAMKKGKSLDLQKRFPLSADDNNHDGVIKTLQKLVF